MEADHHLQEINMNPPPPGPPYIPPCMYTVSYCECLLSITPFNNSQLESYITFWVVITYGFGPWLSCVKYQFYFMII